MAHQRKLIRHAVVAQLLDRTAAGARVVANQTEPWKNVQLPCIGIYTPEETVDEDKTQRPRELIRGLALTIVGWALHTDANPAVDALDDLAEQIENVIDADPYFGGTAGLDGATLTGTETAFEDDERHADPLIGVIRLSYFVPYTTTPKVASLDDYLRTGVTTQIDGAAANNTVSDLFDQQP